MKKVLIAAGVAVLAMTAIAGAAALSLGGNLSVGSTGADVTALQNWLIGAGYNIPSVASKAVAPGYFGAQTNAAVRKYQASVGLPSTGFVGPLTRAKLSGSAVVTTTPAPFTCPAGYECKAVVGTTPVVTTGSITTPGVAGTIAFSLQSTPSNGTSVDKGNSSDIARYKLQAGASDMQVTSLSLDFDSRFWLYASSITIKDETGAVVAQKSGLSQSDFTELTVGSSYRLYVPMNFVVAKTATKYIVVNVSLLPVTDRSAGNLTITQAQLRSVDGTGVTDTETETADRYFAFTGSNNGQIVVTADASSPLKRLVQVSTSAETDNVVLGIVDVKSQNKDSNLRSLNVYVKTNGTSVSTIFNDIKIKAGNLVYSADSINTSSAGNTTSSSTAVFTNMMIPLPKDTYVPITILGKVAKDTSGTTITGAQASTTLLANGANLVAEDTTFNAVTVNSATFISNDSIFTSSSALVSGASAVVGAPVTSNNVTVRYPVTYTFTMSAGDNTLYLSNTPGIALGTTTTGYTSNASTNASSTITILTSANPGSLAGDASTYYVIPAGSSRTFVFNGVMQYEANNTAPKTHAISTIYYGTSSSSLQGQSINYGLEALKAVATF